MRTALKLLSGLSAALVLVLAAPALAAAATSSNANSVWCASAGNCTAIGSYTATDGAQDGLLLSEVKGRWQPGQLVALPAGAGASPAATLNDLWCTKGPDCVAVGIYSDGAGNQQALVLNEKNGAWSTAKRVALPKGAIGQGSQLAELNAVWCANAANCVAAGDYTDADGNQQGLTVTETNGVWGQGSATPVPSNANADPQVALTALDCTAISSCDVMGIYDDQDGNQEGEILVGAAPSWGNGEANLPGDAALAAQQVQINALACGAAESCVGAGAFVDDSGNQQPLIIFANGSTFSTLEPPLPANADSGSNPDAQLTSVWCASAGNCSVVGDYNDANSNQQGLLLNETNGSFAAGSELSLPADADQSNSAANPNVALNSVWCASAGNCVAAGGYTNTTQAEVPLVAHENAGTWSGGSSFGLPSGAGTAANQSAALASIWCTGLGSCSTVGSFTSANGDAQALLSSSRAGSFAAGVASPAPPSAAQERTSLAGLITAPSHTTLAKVARTGLTFRYSALAPGRVTLKWVHEGVTVASAPAVTLAKAETVTLRLTFSAAARRAVAKARGSWQIQAQAQFTPVAPTGAATVNASHSFTLR